MYTRLCSKKECCQGYSCLEIELTKNFLGPCDQKNSNGQLERGVQLKR